MGLRQIRSLDNSNALNAIRWISAFLVLVGHIEMVAVWHTGQSICPSAYHLAHLAVMAFFVLSGYVISYCAKKTISPLVYFLDRLTRIYSVLIPAVILTVLLDFIGHNINPEFYTTYLPKGSVLIRFFVNILGLQGWGNHRIQFGTNSPLWSIGYELLYYTLYGILAYQVFNTQRSSTQKLIWATLTLTILIIAGYKMAIYAVIWFCGVFCFYIKNYRSFSCSWIIVLPFALIITSFAYLYVSPGYLQDLIFAVGLASLLIIKGDFPIAKKWNKFLVDFSYSLYSCHLPVIFFLFASIWRETFNLFYFSVVVMGVTIVFSILFARLFEKGRYQLRNYLLDILKRELQK